MVLKIGMSPLVNTNFVTLLTNSYKAQNENHEILLIEENLDVLDEKLNNRELDLILVPIVKKSSSKNSLRLYDEDLFFIDHVDNPQSLPIRLTPMTATCRVPPLSRVKLGIGWSRGVARDAEQ